MLSYLLRKGGLTWSLPVQSLGAGLGFGSSCLSILLPPGTGAGAACTEGGYTAQRVIQSSGLLSCQAQVILKCVNTHTTPSHLKRSCYYRAYKTRRVCGEGSREINERDKTQKTTNVWSRRVLLNSWSGTNQFSCFQSICLEVLLEVTDEGILTM